ncbi:hypothetical protein [Oenococcus kitaharae]|uniref:YobI-like P-loop NTPase domain-containing protein n=1 Tax=Oenococcus kitaharae DSM 17330 TaxID=1045004 RepID=G9WF41_9LACO|nr:hypothetical protein [Oenococcus kitaharae]EHN58601.1 hypothetical protein OKIT_0485 [Oenococcus kitaharae DSM 17330]
MKQNKYEGKIVDNKEQLRDQLQPLSPNKHLDNEEYHQYVTYLDQALTGKKSSEIDNIAIAGKYGSGKSSIIDSYFAREDNPNKNNYLKVSFATFNKKPLTADIEKDDQTENTKEERKHEKKQNARISANIINQIIYQVDPKKIPLTRFKVKRPILISNQSAICIELVLLLSLWLNFHLFWPKNVAFVINGVRAVLIITLFIYLLFQLLARLEISKFKISLKSVDTEIDTSNDDLFEKYIDEIVYLFEKSGKRILIIEDLDRFDNLTIFEKLRELNIKLNHINKFRKSAQHWQFIYLIKDDIFADPNDRVKFFDLIIPVIPYITSNNSFDKLTSFFPKNNDRLRYILSLYIDDYRLLLNIHNEYQVFESIGSATGNTAEKDQLLALIAYKNKFPDRFDDLQNGKGELAEIVSSYKANIEKQVNAIDQKIIEIKIQKDSTIANKEAEYLYYWARKNNLVYYATANDFTRRSINTFDLAQHIIQKNLVVQIGNENREPYLDFKSNQVNYANDLRNVTAFDEELQKLRSQKELITKQPLQNIDKDVFEGKPLNEMLYALIRSGYIKEDYLYVINHYYGDNANRIFMRGLLSDSDDFDTHLHLTKIGDLIPRLEAEDFSKKQILNFDLLAYLFTENQSDKLLVMLETAIRYKSGFIEEAINLEYSDSNIDLEDKPTVRNPLVEQLQGFHQKVLELQPQIHFDLSQFTSEFWIADSNLEDIIKHNRYDDTNSNEEILISYLDQLTDNKLNLQIINNETVYVALKQKIITDILARVDLADITNNDLKKLALQKNKIHKTTENLLAYFDLSGKVFDEKLVEFINNNNWESSSIKGLSDEFYQKFVATENISEPQFTVFMKASTDIAGWLSDALINNLKPEKIKILFELGGLPIKATTIQLLIDKDVQVGSTLIDKDFKQLVVDKKISLSKALLLNVLKTPGKNNKLILSRNLSLLTQDKIHEQLRQLHDDDSDKLLKVMDHVRGFTSVKLDNLEPDTNLLHWMKDQSLISNFEVLGGSRLRVKK